MRALSLLYLHHRTASHWAVVVCCHYRRLSGTCLLFFIFVPSLRYIHMHLYVYEKSMHVYIVTKCDWSLHIYKHIAQGMRVHTIYTLTYCIRARLSFISHIGPQHSTCYFRYWYLFIIIFVFVFYWAQWMTLTVVAIEFDHQVHLSYVKMRIIICLFFLFRILKVKWK